MYNVRECLMSWQGARGRGGWSQLTSHNTVPDTDTNHEQSILLSLMTLLVLSVNVTLLLHDHIKLIASN